MVIRRPQEVVPEVKLIGLFTGHVAAAAVYTAASLNLIDHIASGANSTAELARATKTHQPSVYRLLRFLASLGVVEEIGPDRFFATSVGAFLRSDHPNSLRALALFYGGSPMFKGLGALDHSIKTGGAAFDHAHGKSLWEYCGEDDAFSALFNEAMTQSSAFNTEAVLAAYDFTGIRKLVDVGGGHGFFLSSVLESYPALKGCLMDRPQVVEAGRERIKADFGDRVEVFGGDFFKAVPSGDAYILRNVIHDWDDEHSIRILKRTAKAMDGNGKVLVVEMIVPAGNDPAFVKLLDIVMMVGTSSGRERTEAEFADLMDRAGLRLNRVVRTLSDMSVIEAVRA